MIKRGLHSARLRCRISWVQQQIELGNTTRNELQSVQALPILRQKPTGNKMEV